MAVKCLVVCTLVLLLGVVCARELQVASKLKVDPGIFISLETLRRLEAKAKNNGTEVNGNTNTTPAEDPSHKVDDGDKIGKSTTNAPDNKNDPVSTDTNLNTTNLNTTNINTTNLNTTNLNTTNLNTTNLDTVENQTNRPILNTNDTKTEKNLNESVTSVPNVNDTTKKPTTTQPPLYPHQATSQQALLAYQKIQWPINQQYPYGSEQQIYHQNPYQQFTYGSQQATFGPNQQNLGFHQVNQPALFNQQLHYNYNEPQPFSVNPQPTFDPNQHYQQQSFLVQQRPYPMLSNQPPNQHMNLISMNPISMSLPYSQVYPPLIRN